VWACGARGLVPSPSPARGLEPRPHPRSRVLPKLCLTRALLTCLGALLTWCATSPTLHRRRARGMQSSRGVKSGSCGPLITIRPESGPGLPSSSMLPRSMLAFGGVRLQPLLAWGLCWLVACGVMLHMSRCTCLARVIFLLPRLSAPVSVRSDGGEAGSLEASCARSARRCCHIAAGGIKR
jgi:hypothetical protein